MLVISANTEGGGKQSDSTLLRAQVIHILALRTEPKQAAQMSYGVVDPSYKPIRFSLKYMGTVM